MDVSIILPVVNERENLCALIPRLHALLDREHLSHEIIVVDGGSTDGTREAAGALDARVIPECRRGYAGAIETGFAEARGDYILTLDADQSHDPDFATKMWRARGRADIVIASRYARGGVAYTNFVRRVTSAGLNFVLHRMLSMPVRDLSSGYRLYRREAIEGLKLQSVNFEVIEEILVKAYARGFSIVEVPFTYFPRGAGRSHAKLLQFGWQIVKSSLKLWKMRNSLESADYDERAFYSIIPIQRYWHRRRHHVTVSWARGAGRVLDAGCGSSLIVQSLNDAIGMDFNFAKLRFLRRYGMPLTNASAFALPFKDSSFDCVISSEVIEHLPYDEVLFSEMSRVLRPGGMLILETPDYSTIGWQIIEPVYGFLMPGGYKDEHITHYSLEKLSEILPRHGFAIEEASYIARSDLMLRCRKIETAAAGSESVGERASSAA
ncbi:MAG: glycosyltransferase [Candidatus Binatus sp.]|uniref:glycosyltransferase n=1 Tax=Candidatus Binatus sp. TaxID=2811406 RepID=UPI00272385F2|nr:glycosyltransferase [Candidatus Binatus sp.]MDO8431354.1 glycosyltransferase [Candidatus Binatus sp.]